MLPDLHDCGFVSEQIKALGPREQLLDDASAGERALCAIVFSDGAPAPYWIDSGAEPIIRLFEHPHSCREVVKLLSEALGTDQFDGHFLEDIVRAGIIVRSLESAPKTDASFAATA
jgi:hypothetical protein